MDEQQDKATGWKRGKDAFRRMRITAEVVGVVANPLAGPVAQHAHLEPVPSEQGIVQEIDRGEVKDGAEWERHLREQEAGKVVREVRPAEPDRAKEAKRGKSAERSRQRD